ncbi:oxidoreductase [Lactiplantibacillus daowaiensis]|uniref:Oxidoreductase n=1 Tax=Lactiplantibacillus daowaiensis TaxID=2559918 RepID=A0ABW1RZ35_9LACO|nr:oxidoreductase [Lactiplantibacillus daowaiensis]
MKTILITGASSGIGRQTAIALAKQGHTVYGAARRLDKLQDLVQFNIKPIQLDVTDPDSCQVAVKTIIAAAGRIDVLINNAGYGSYGAVEDVPLAEAKQQFDVNLFGLASLTKLVLPYMRQQHAGTIINTSSMGGRLTSFMGAWYHATKYAIEGFSDALRMETRPFGIHVVLIEPGAIKTNWGSIAADHLAASAKDGAYAEMATSAAAGMRRLYGSKLLSRPEIVSRAMLKAVNHRHPRPRYLIGMGAKPLVFLHTILPTRWFDTLMIHAS